MNTHQTTISTLVNELAEFSRQLLLIQIERLEDELIPCAEVLQTARVAVACDIDNVVISTLSNKLNHLQHLKSQLASVEELCAA